LQQQQLILAAWTTPTCMSTENGALSEGKIDQLKQAT